MKKHLLAVLLCVSVFCPQWLIAQKTISTDDVRYWVGNGENYALLVVNWEFADEALVWGYRWSSSSSPVVQDMINHIDLSDAYLTVDNSGGFINDFQYIDRNCLNLSLSGDDSENMGWWMYAVNDIMAPVGVASQVLVNGDVIHFKYCISSFEVGAMSPNISLTFPVSSSFAVTKRLTADLCPGDVYHKNGFDVLADDYRVNSQVTFKRTQIVSCEADTLFELLVTIGQNFDLIDSLTIKTSQLPYEYGDITIAQGEQSGTKQYQLTSSTGCDSLITLTLTIESDAVDVADNTYHEAQLFVTSNGLLSVGNSQSIDQLIIYTTLGSVVETYSQFAENGPLSITHLSKGVYVVRIRYRDGSVVTKKIIV